MRNTRAAGTIAMILGVFGLFAAGAGSAGATTTGAHPDCSAPPILCPLPAPGHPAPAKPGSTVTKQAKDTVSVNPGKGKIIVACAKHDQPPAIISAPGKTKPSADAVPLPEVSELPGGAVPSDARTVPAKPVNGSGVAITKLPAGAGVEVTKLPADVVPAKRADGAATKPAGAVPAKPVGKGQGPIIICRIPAPAK